MSPRSKYDPSGLCGAALSYTIKSICSKRYLRSSRTLTLSVEIRNSLGSPGGKSDLFAKELKHHALVNHMTGGFNG